MSEVVLLVPDMACQGCAATIRDALTDLGNVEIGVIDPQTKQVKVETDLDSDTIFSTIKDAGFSPEPYQKKGLKRLFRK